MAKICKKCNEKKDLNAFDADLRASDKLSTRCSTCLSEHRASLKVKQTERSIAWRKANPEIWKEIEFRSKSKNREKVLARMRSNHAANADKRRHNMRCYYSSNKEAILESRKKNPNFRISKTLRSRISCAINRAKSGTRKQGSAVKDLGCTVGELIAYLEQQFEPGMNWSNHAVDGWHIDHVIPLSSFDLSDIDQFKKACHYTNLQPLWAPKNLSKGGKLG